MNDTSASIRPLGKWDAEAYALFRFVAGFLFAFHGAQKLFGTFGFQKALNPMMLAAGVIELVGGVLIALGLFAGVAAFVASGQMAVAYFKAHFTVAAFWPIENKGELAALYCFVFLCIAAKGSGLYSVDSLLRDARLRAPRLAEARLPEPHLHHVARSTSRHG